MRRKEHPGDNKDASKKAERYLLHPISLSTDQVPPAQRFDFWQALLPKNLTFTPQPGMKPEDFHQSITGFGVDQLMMAKTHSSAKHYKVRAPMGAQSLSDVYMLRVFHSGGYDGENGSVSFHARAGDICLLDMACPSQLQVATSETLALAIPRHVLARYIDTDLSPGRVIPRDTAVNRILGHQLEAVWQALPQASPDETSVICDMLLSAVVGAFSQGGVHAPMADKKLEAMTLGSMRAYIDQHLGSDLTVKHLCQQFGLSRSKLYRLFAPLGGIADYIRDSRLQRCYETLTDPDADFKRISDVSAYWGFSNYCHFTRLFRSHFGMTPGDAVELRASASYSETVARPEVSLVHQWLQKLQEK